MDLQLDDEMEPSVALLYATVADTLRRITMGILSGNPTDEPMHYGEVFGTWSFLSASKGLVAGYQTFLNHVGDKAPIVLTFDLLNDFCFFMQ